MKRVFISYSREDEVQLETIRQAVLMAEVDDFHDREMMGGERFPERLQEEIRRSLCLVVHLTEHSVASSWVRREVELADRMRRPIIPLYKTGDLGPPSKLRKPRWVVQLLRSVNAIRYQHRIGPRTQRALAEAIKRVQSLPRAGKIVSFVNFKGGVGKTTLCALSGYYLARAHGLNVLMLDLDPQENLTDLFLTPDQATQAVTESNTALSLFEPARLQDEPVGDDFDYRLLPAPRGPVLPEDILSIATDLEGPAGNRFSIIPADMRMMKFFLASREIQDIYRANFDSALQVLVEAYDYVLIDCGPSASLLSYCAFSLADQIVAPVRPNPSATRGLLTMSQAALRVFDHPVDDKIHPVFNFSRGRNDERRYMASFTTRPELVADDLEFVLGRTLETVISWSANLIGLTEAFARRELMSPTATIDELDRHLGPKVSGQIRALSHEIMAITNGVRNATQEPEAG